MSGFVVLVHIEGMVGKFGAGRPACLPSHAKDKCLWGCTGVSKMDDVGAVVEQMFAATRTVSEGLQLQLQLQFGLRRVEHRLAEWLLPRS